jgi:hypothetical protein
MGFPLQQWLHERASMLRDMYSARLVWFELRNPLKMTFISVTCEGSVRTSGGTVCFNYRHKLVFVMRIVYGTHRALCDKIHSFLMSHQVVHGVATGVCSITGC